MKSRTLIAAVGLCTLLPGCGTIKPPPLTNVFCNVSGPCIVPVHVDNCVVSAPSIRVPSTVTVYWTLDDQSTAYQFPADSLNSPGVWIEDDDPNNPQFVDAARVTSYQFQLRDRQVSRKWYRYGVSVAKTDGTLCPTVRGTISNVEFY